MDGTGKWKEATPLSINTANYRVKTDQNYLRARAIQFFQKYPTVESFTKAHPDKTAFYKEIHDKLETSTKTETGLLKGQNTNVSPAEDWDVTTETYRLAVAMEGAGEV